MTELQKEETHNFMCRLSQEDHQKLKVISSAYNRSMTSQIRQLIQDCYREHGDAMEEHLAGRIQSNYPNTETRDKIILDNAHKIEPESLREEMIDEAKSSLERVEEERKENNALDESDDNNVPF